jgi:tetratricopeptide (TPR) repeat protein
MAYISRVLRLKPNDPYFLNNRGYVFLMMGEKEQALADINQSIMTDPGNAWAYRNKGIYHLQNGDAPNAIRLLTQALDMSDFIEQGHYYLAQAYLANKEKQKACEHFRQAFEFHEITEEVLKRNCP